MTGMGNYTGSAKAQYIPVTPGYYVLHQNGKGYLKVSGAGVNLGNDGTFQSGNLFDKGNCIWYMTPEGYLQNEYFYLNAANNNTLYLSVNPVTRWRSEDVTGENTYGKKHLKINDGTNDLYLCNNGSSITLQAGPSAYYSACPVTVEEVSWTDAPAADNLTVQSPQLVTYLRAYFTQKLNTISIMMQVLRSNLPTVNMSAVSMPHWRMHRAVMVKERIGILMNRVYSITKRQVEM